MPSLIALIENEFVSRYSSKSKRLEDVLATDEDCAAFIRQVLDDASYSIAGATRNKKQYDFSKDRAKHSVITYFMGLILAKFGDLEARINSLMPESGTFEHLWMLTALYHDWGYYSDRINNGSLKLRSVVKHYLLSDIDLDSRLGKLANYEISHPEALAYSYDEIEEYDAYARRYHGLRPNDYEKIDHGILGGVIIYDRLIKKALGFGKNDECLAAKASCVTIAQHNIFKSSSEKMDLEYGSRLKKLFHDSSFVITTETPLLFLLSLVDTIECVKRFSGESNKDRYFHTKTVLSNIELDVSRERIRIDYRKFRTAIEKKNKNVLEASLAERYRKYTDGILSFDHWTSVRASYDTTSNDVIQIEPITSYWFLQPHMGIDDKEEIEEDPEETKKKEELFYKILMEEEPS